MLIFHDPVTIIAATGLALGAAGAVTSGVQAQGQARAQAADLRLQADLETTASQRDIRDERLKNKRRLARTRAVLSAGGVDPGVLAGLVAAEDTESRIRQGRLTTDSAVRRSTLRTRARNVRAGGTAALAGSVLGVGGSLLTGGAELSREL